MTTKVGARRKLELSRLDKKAIQREAMGTDVDIGKFVIYLSSVIKVDLAELITDANINRTIEGASTLTVEIFDPERKVLRSGLLNNKLDVQLDGLWFRLTGFDKRDDTLTLTFEDREIAVLRSYAKWKVVRRTKATRAEFVLNLIREVREFKIPVVIPELHKIQPIEKYPGDPVGVDAAYNKNKGIAPDTNQAGLQGDDRFPAAHRSAGKFLNVKGIAADTTQIRMASTITSVGEEELAGHPRKRKLIVCAIMTAITESTLRNNPGGDLDSAGLFQQRPGWGSYADRTDPATSSRLFYKAAKRVDADNPEWDYWLICADVQNPRQDLRGEYAKYRTEAERFVNAYGLIGKDSETNSASANNQLMQSGSGESFIFWRGKVEDRRGKKIRKPENSWSCIQRLADEVDWRAFFVSGTFYFMSEDDLLKQQPTLILQEWQEGILSIDGNYDNAKKAATVEVRAVLGRWEAPPSAIVVLKDMGPLNGRWLVTEYSRSLFDTEATITLKKARPALPEPVDSNVDSIDATWYDKATQPPSSDTRALTGMMLRNAVLSDKLITFTRASQNEDVKTGQMDEDVLRFLLWMTDAGNPCVITALKSDHNVHTTNGNISAHSVGKAVDVGNYTISNNDTDRVMARIGNNQAVLGFSQLIGPNPSLCIPLGYYDQNTLDEHKDHIHVGWPL